MRSPLDDRPVHPIAEPIRCVPAFEAEGEGGCGIFEYGATERG